MPKVVITGLNTADLPKFTAKEGEELLRKLKQGDEEARERFLQGNLRLVLSIVGRFPNSSDVADDLFQVGCIGLMKAVNNFDTTLDVRFSTYAVPMIIGEIRRYLRDKSGIKVSRNLRDTAYKALKTREEMQNRENTTAFPTLFEIAEELNMPISEIACALDAVSDTVSLNESAYSEGDDMVEIADLLADKQNTVENWTDNIALSDALQKLPEREKQIITLRYFNGKTQTEISQMVNISQAQVSRLEKNGIAILKRHFS